MTLTFEFTPKEVMDALARIANAPEGNYSATVLFMTAAEPNPDSTPRVETVRLILAPALSDNGDRDA